MAEFFEMHQSGIAKIKRQYWDAINNDDMYPDLQPQKRGNVDADSFYNMVVKRRTAGLHQTEATCCQTFTDYYSP